MFGREKRLGDLYIQLENNKELAEMDLFHYPHYSCYISTPIEDRTYWLESTARVKISRRVEVVNTLKAINYERKDSRWTTQSVVGFIDEVIDLNKNYSTEQAMEISKRYNVEPNRFNQQVSMFMSLKRSTYSLNWYFSDYEYTAWKYRDAKTLKKALENETITQKEIDALKELNLFKVDNQ